MKLITAIILGFIAFCASADECKRIYTSDVFSLCAKYAPDLGISPHKTYSIFGKTKISKSSTHLSDEVDLEGVSDIKKADENKFFYKAYFGGNSINAENRHVLLILTDNAIKYAGEFSGYDDIDGDGINEFYAYEEPYGTSHANVKYMKKKLVIKNDKLQRQ